jgi:hemoglobin
MKTNEDAMNKVSMKYLRLVVLCAVVTAFAGCGTGKGGMKKDDFFTSGSREADQRASQRMAKDEQLTGSGEGAGEKGVKKAKAGEETATGEPKAAQAENKLTLFERLGGEQGIAAIVDDFTTRALEDPRVDWERKALKRGGIFKGKSEAWRATPENVANLKKHLAQFIALATGGPPQYDGKSIKAAHAGMTISNAEFDAAIGDLKAALDKMRIPNKEQKELLATIESTRPEIVTER